MNLQEYQEMRFFADQQAFYRAIKDPVFAAEEMLIQKYRPVHVPVEDKGRRREMARACVREYPDVIQKIAQEMVDSNLADYQAGDFEDEQTLTEVESTKTVDPIRIKFTQQYLHLLDLLNRHPEYGEQHRINKALHLFGIPGLVGRRLSTRTERAVRSYRVLKALI